MNKVFCPEEFFADYWRKKPLFIKGGAEAFLGLQWKVEDFDDALEKAVSSNAPIKQREGEVTFVENISKYNPKLESRISYFSQLFGLPTVWFDSIRTYSDSGIGEHFDHSDNFVINMQGTKQWKLASPSYLAKTDIAKRMMNIPGIGAQELPEDEYLHFTLESGDLLYLPLFWLHSGVSEGPSLSLSLVCPAISLYSLVAPLLTRIMRNKMMGYEPIPTLHSYLTGQQKIEEFDSILNSAKKLVQSACSNEITEDLENMLTEMILNKGFAKPQ